MATYSVLSEDEKNSIRQSAVRSLEFQMYALELDKIAESAKTTPDADRLAFLNSAIAEKEAQIEAL
jgi:hypothetical protein